MHFNLNLFLSILIELRIIYTIYKYLYNIQMSTDFKNVGIFNSIKYRQ